MLLEILIATLIGILFGIFTGLTPGIHINLVAATLLTLSPFFLKFTSIIVLASFIIAMSITHTFLDSIPSIFLGAPDADEALGTLPGHRYLMKGYGLMAVKLTILGSFFGLLLSLLLYIPLMPFVKFIYPLIEDYIPFILIAIALFMVLRDNMKLWAAFIFLISGALGYITLSWPNLRNPLFPLLSGLFGVSTLLYSIRDNNRIPEQKFDDKTALDKPATIKALLSGQFSGFVTAVLPGIGAATAAVMSLQITKKLGDHGFMILTGSIGMVNFMLSILTFQVLDKARNGSVAVIQQLYNVEVQTYVFITLILVAIISAGVAVWLTLFFGKKFSYLITKVNYKKLVIGIILLILTLTIALSGIIGLAILIVSTSIGLIPAIKKTARAHAMGCLLVPVILFFIL